ncbi:MAG: tyrosine--tRNA ligase [Planctomycetota bacterium]|jgi:tyrosyl-tRNA synthetase
MAFPPVEEQLDRLRPGTVDIHTEEALRKKLERSITEDEPLRIKQGFDPTAPDIHLGHTIGLNKLKQFQSCGHTIVLIVGDYTGMVGDPSDRQETRRSLTYEEVRENAKTYMEQFFKVLDPEGTEVHYNGEWFSKMSFNDVMDLASRYTVAKILARNDFKERMREGVPISVHEFFYILMQGYDSVVIRADVEIGATEQLFNLLSGRDIQASYGQEPQVALTLPVLTGIDGKERMSKSTGNYIGVTEPPQTMFGKVMSIPDALLPEWLDLLSGLPPSEIASLADPARANPRDTKETLGRILVERYHSAAAAAEAVDAFRKVFALKELPEDMPEMAVPPKEWIIRLVRTCGFASSSSEARRLVAQGGVSLYRAGVKQEKVTDPAAELALETGDVLRVGKIRFARLRVAPPS